MIFEFKNTICRITAVEHLKWENGDFDIAPRPYAALSFRIKGSATIEANNKSYSVNSNDILYIPQNLPYFAHYSETEIFVIHFTTLSNDPEPEVYSFSDTEEIHKLFTCARILWQSRNAGFEAYIMAKLFLILGKLCEAETTESIPSYFLNAISYIRSNYANSKLTVDMICKSSGIGATKLRQLFKKHHQKTPVEYITGLRLEYARNLLSGGLTVEEAAEKSGFSDSKYFARVVKKYYSCTPRTFRLYGK